MRQTKSAIQPTATVQPAVQPTREISFASFADLKAKYDELNAEAYKTSKAWAYGIVGGFRKQIVPILGEVRDVLSQRGKFHDPNNDLPCWTEWYEDFAIDINQLITGAVAEQQSVGITPLPSLRMIQIELKQLTDGKPVPARGRGRPKGSGKGSKSPEPTNPETARAAQNLADAHGQLGAAAEVGSADAAKIIAGSAGEYEDALAKTEAAPAAPVVDSPPVDEKEEEESEEERALSQYRVTLTVGGKRLSSVQKKLHEMFPDLEKDDMEVEKLGGRASRADRLDDAAAQVESAKETVDELRGELEEWRDNLPENLQSGEKASELEEAIGSLESLSGELENINWDVEFPSMMG